jgi:pimeloyl-ACP methyl ester carboxylesterase
MNLGTRGYCGNPHELTIIGHSEGTVIAPRVAIDNNNTTTKVKNIVLMGIVAQNVRELLYFQDVITPVLYAEKVLDHDHNGLLSVSEAYKDPVFRSMVGDVLLALETTNRTKHQLNATYNTNNDTYISINNELKPKLVEQHESILDVKENKIWVESHDTLGPTSNIIGKVPSSTGILLLNGLNDSNTPVQQAFLLQQKLTDINHPDHVLITYPDLGHAFYPSSQWLDVFGPIEQYVLADLYAWLEAHSGFTQSPSPSSSFSNSSSTGQG